MSYFLKLKRTFFFASDFFSFFSLLLKSDFYFIVSQVGTLEIKSVTPGGLVDRRIFTEG